jgi:hypothetical protein
MLRPYVVLGVSIPVTAHPSLPPPGLRLPLGRQRLAPGAALSLLVHVAVIALLVIRGRDLLARAAGTPGERGGGGEGGMAVNFFTLPPAPAPAEVPIPAAPAVSALPLPDPQALRQIHMDLPPLQLPAAVTSAAAGGGVAGGGGGGPGAGGGQGGGVGGNVGPGTGGEGGYIVVASPRTAILPPLAKVPGSVTGRTFLVRFWVSAEGRVTRVEVEPPIPDASYAREFQRRMMAYQFYPARTWDGRNVASVVAVSLQIGN